MAKSFPVGHMRVNPNTYETEVWDGTKWNNTNMHGVTTTLPTSGYTTIASSGNITSNGITTSTFSGTSSRPTISATERELIFDFLKQNMRVAEYVDDKGKVHTVQLEMRAGEGYTWENIRRVKTKDPL